MFVGASLAFKSCIVFPTYLLKYQGKVIEINSIITFLQYYIELILLSIRSGYTNLSNVKSPFLPNAKKYSIKTSEIAEPVLESLAMTSRVIGRSLRDLKKLLFSPRSG